jgi:hypothetical protein
MSKKIKLKLEKSEIMYLAGALGFALEMKGFQEKDMKTMRELKERFEKYYTKEDVEELRAK